LSIRNISGAPILEGGERQTKKASGPAGGMGGTPALTQLQLTVRKTPEVPGMPTCCRSLHCLKIAYSDDIANGGNV